MKELLEADLYVEPFPLMVVQNFYNKIELELIWKELDFYTSPNKLFEAKEYGGVVDRTNAKAICLDELYKGQENKKNFRNISNILTVNRKLFNSGVLDKFSQLHECCTLATESNHDVTKVGTITIMSIMILIQIKVLCSLPFHIFIKNLKNLLVAI